jgi:hypothetical protein
MGLMTSVQSMVRTLDQVVQCAPLEGGAVAAVLGDHGAGKATWVGHAIHGWRTQPLGPQRNVPKIFVHCFGTNHAATSLRTMLRRLLVCDGPSSPCFFLFSPYSVIEPSTPCFLSSDHYVGWGSLLLVSEHAFTWVQASLVDQQESRLRTATTIKLA